MCNLLSISSSVSSFVSLCVMNDEGERHSYHGMSMNEMWAETMCCL